MQNPSSCHGVGKRVQNKNNTKQCTIFKVKQKTKKNKSNQKVKNIAFLLEPGIELNKI
jgi:hypothetical protein